MTVVSVTTAFNIDLEFNTATFGRRAFAWFIDLVFISIYNYIVDYYVLEPLGYSSKAAFVIFFLCTAIPCFLYNLIFEIFFNGQSLGKRIMRLKVISRDGDEASLSQYIIRWLLGLGNYIMFVLPYLIEASLENGIYLISLVIVIGLFYLPDILSIAISAKSQRLGDLAAGTVVIDQHSRTNLQDTIYLEIEDKNYKALFPQVMRLTDRDINGIRNLLDAKKTDRETIRYSEQIANRIKEVLNIESDLEPQDFLHQLLQDYNYLTHK